MLEYKGYTGEIYYSQEDGCWWGKVLSDQNTPMVDLICFEGGADSMQQEFEDAVDDYIKTKYSLQEWLG